MASIIIPIVIGLEAIITIFVLVMLWRFVKAHEAISRHLLEIARDLKRASDHLSTKDE